MIAVSGFFDGIGIQEKTKKNLKIISEKVKKLKFVNSLAFLHYFIGLLISLVTFTLYSSFMPLIYKTSISLALPMLSVVEPIWYLKAIDWFLFVLFTIIYGVLLPFAEEAFYRVFQFVHYRSFLFDLLVSLMYALMSYAAFFWTVEGQYAKLLFTAISFIMCIVLMIIRNSTGYVYALMFRLGLSNGVCSWLMILILIEYLMQDKETGQLLINDPENVYQQILY